MTKAKTLQILKKEVLRLQDGSRRLSPCEGIELGPITAAFPQGYFPCVCLHELLSDHASNAAAATGFIAAILGKLTANGRAGVWISTKRQLFAPGLAAFGLHPDQILFITLPTEKQLLWAAEEAVKCEGLAGVIISSSGIRGAGLAGSGSGRSRVCGRSRCNDWLPAGRSPIPLSIR